MKVLKKINKGLILTIIVLLILTIYLVKIEQQRKADKTDINAVCKEFIDFTNKYTVFPEEMQVLGQTLSEEQTEAYKKEMKNELKKLMIDNEEAVNIQYKVYETVLMNGYNEQKITTSQTRKINKITEYEFDGNKVTVKLQNEVDSNIKYFDGIEERTEKKSFATGNDEIILQKIDSKWKIVYSNLEFNDNSTYYEDTMVIY